jgi:hypothetical protein
MDDQSPEKDRLSEMRSERSNLDPDCPGHSWTSKVWISRETKGANALWLDRSIERASMVHRHGTCPCLREVNDSLSRRRGSGSGSRISRILYRAFSVHVSVSTSECSSWPVHVNDRGFQRRVLQITPPISIRSVSLDPGNL